MNKYAQIFLGLFLLIGMILLAWFSSIGGWTIFGKSFDLLHAGWLLAKGILFWMVVFLGLLLIALGIFDLKD